MCLLWRNFDFLYAVRYQVVCPSLVRPSRRLDWMWSDDRISRIVADQRFRFATHGEVRAQSCRVVDHCQWNEVWTVHNYFVGNVGVEGQENIVLSENSDWRFSLPREGGYLPRQRYNFAPDSAEEVVHCPLNLFVDLLVSVVDIIFVIPRFRA